MWRATSDGIHSAQQRYDVPARYALTVRIGILGGTFDPPHVGHLIVASDAVEALQLDRLVFIPNARQPLKSDASQSSAVDRLAMVRLAASPDHRFEVDALEVDRGGLSYSVETLETFATRFPGSSLYFLVGADASRTFAQWRAPRRIAELATVAIMRRRDADPCSGDDADVIARIVAATGSDVVPPMFVETRRVDLSSTEVRERVRTGRPILGFVPEAVARFIAERGLYHERHV
ncbi:MAG: nicotinate-nucleotide adenylyltransferase [Gemmatimonadaceae bacterium]